MLTNKARVIISWIAVFAIFTNYSLIAQEPSGIRSQCDLHLSYLGDKYDVAGVIGFATPPASALDDANHGLPSTVSTVVIAPTNVDEYNRMFPSSATSGNVEEIRDVAARLQQMSLAAGSDWNGDNFEARLKQSKASYIILVGHNDGGNFIFTNGSNLLLADMVVTASDQKKRLIVLSCRAKNYVPKGTPATSGEISYPEALVIAGKLSKFIEGRNGATSLSEINSQLTPIEGQATQHFRWKYIIVAGCKAAVSGVAIALLVYALSDDDKKKKKNKNQIDKKEPHADVRPEQTVVIEVPVVLSQFRRGRSARLTDARFSSSRRERSSSWAMNFSSGRRVWYSAASTLLGRLSSA